MNYQGSALQDRFACNILLFKKNGFYLDIGSCGAISCNNTYCLEELGWKGICIELSPEHIDSYKQRSCSLINEDATQIDYTALFEKYNTPYWIDYLSLDVDTASTEVLKKLPFDTYRFGVITIEHDFYIHGDIFRGAQREILSNNGYILLCSDVLVPVTHDTKPNCPFEDWWIHQSILDQRIKAIESHGEYPSVILAKFKEKH